MKLLWGFFSFVYSEFGICVSLCQKRDFSFTCLSCKVLWILDWKVKKSNFSFYEKCFHTMLAIWYVVSLVFGLQMFLVHLPSCFSSPSKVKSLFMYHEFQCPFLNEKRNPRVKITNEEQCWTKTCKYGNKSLFTSMCCSHYFQGYMDLEMQFSQVNVVFFFPLLCMRTCWCVHKWHWPTWSYLPLSEGLKLLLELQLLINHFARHCLISLIFSQISL